MATTLPREIIKWIQGLDLSYSVKDAKRDLTDGFLIAEILSRYHPGKIQMHSFDHSQNKEKRENNWFLLEKFFTKYEFPIERKDYEKIILENDVPVLIEFMIKLYTNLTNRKINKNPLIAIQTFNKEVVSQAKLEEMNQSFLLKDKGLEKIKEEEKEADDKREEKNQEEKEKRKEEKSPEDNTYASGASSNKLKNFFKAQSKPIASTATEIQQFNIQVKGTNVRQINANISKLRATKEMNLMNSSKSQTLSDHFGLPIEHTPSTPHQHLQQQHFTMSNESSKFHSTKKGEKVQEKSIYDIIQDLLNMKFITGAGQYENELKRFTVKTYGDILHTFPDDFNEIVFKEILDKIDPLANFIARDTNEIWKFLNFMLTCLKNTFVDKDYFKTIIDIFRHMGERLVYKDPAKCSKVFQEYFLETIAQQLTTAPVFEKKEQITLLLYYFIPPTPEAKHQIISSFKNAVKNQNLFMQALVVLLSTETRFDKDAEQLFEDFLFYAKTGMQSSHPIVKTMALAILANLAKLNYEFVHEFIENKLKILALEDWWENKCQVIIICSRIIKGIITSDNYQNLIKKLNPQFTKNYSLENELIANKIKADIEYFADTIIKVAQNKSNHHVLRTFIVYCVEIGHEVKSIMDQIVSTIIHSDDEFRNWFFHNTEGDKEEFVVYNDKSLRYKTSFNSELLKKSAKEMLLSLTDIVTKEAPDSFDAAYLEVIEFGLLYTDFKILNIEMLQNIANALISYLFVALCDEHLFESATRIIKIFLQYMMKGDIRIKDLENLFSSAANFIYKNELQLCIENLKEIILWYKDEIEKKKIDREKNTVRDICNTLVFKNSHELFAEEIRNFAQQVIDSLETENDKDRE